MQKNTKLLEINEMAEMKNCNKVLFFESKKKDDLYLWASNSPEGPSANFLVENSKFPALLSACHSSDCPEF